MEAVGDRSMSPDGDVNSDFEENSSGNVQESNLIESNQVFRRDKAYSILSPSHKPDFHRNILSNSKSVSSSVGKFKEEN